MPSREQDALFGPVASDSTAFRMVDRIACDARAAGRGPTGARAGAGAVLGVAWRAAAVDARRRCNADHRAFREGEGGRELQGRLWVSPLQVYLDETREALGGLLRPGNAGSNTADDHKTAIDRALQQIPAEHVESLEILVRADSRRCDARLG